MAWDVSQRGAALHGHDSGTSRDSGLYRRYEDEDGQEQTIRVAMTDEEAMRFYVEGLPLAYWEENAEPIVEEDGTLVSAYMTEALRQELEGPPDG